MNIYTFRLRASGANRNQTVEVSAHGEGDARTKMFMAHPGGTLKLIGVRLEGTGKRDPNGGTSFNPHS